MIKMPGMKTRIVIAVLLLFGLAVAVSAQERASRTWLLSVRGDILSASDLRDIKAGKGWRGTLEVIPQVWGGADKYLISWTAGKRWLNPNARNPAHGRRGNVYISGRSSMDDWAKGFISVRIPAGNTLRVRFRPIFEDGREGLNCVVKISFPRNLTYSVPGDGWFINSGRLC